MHCCHWFLYTLKNIDQILFSSNLVEGRIHPLLVIIAMESKLMFREADAMTGGTSMIWIAHTYLRQQLQQL